MSERASDWNRLDNAAKIFPPTSNKQDTKVFRFACQLNERVEQEILQQATEKTLETFPIFRSVLKHGLFWYYLEKTDLVPVVEPEYRPACGPLYDPASRNLLFEVTCWRNRINLEVYHSLTDGTGALQFLKTLVCNYLSIKYPQLSEELMAPVRSINRAVRDLSGLGLICFQDGKVSVQDREALAKRVHTSRLKNYL